MSLPHALLTALAEHPGSGSELAKRFEKSIGHFWSATHQQIYRELARLEELGWVRSRPVESMRGRKREYQVLAAGRKELTRWLSQPTAPDPLRDELMVRLRAEAVVGPTLLHEDLEQRLALHKKTLRHYRDLERRDFPESADQASRGDMLRRFILQTGVRYEQYWIRTLEDAIRVLRIEEGRDGLTASLEK